MIYPEDSATFKFSEFIIGQSHRTAKFSMIKLVGMFGFISLPVSQVVHYTPILDDDSAQPANPELGELRLEVYTFKGIITDPNQRGSAKKAAPTGIVLYERDRKGLAHCIECVSIVPLR